MKIKKSIRKILAVGGCIALLGATLTGCAPQITQEDLDAKYKEGEARGGESCCCACRGRPACVDGSEIVCESKGKIVRAVEQDVG